MNQHSHSSTQANRSAFTMIEVLVVIGIIALLASMLVMAIAPTLENAKISATKSIIAQVDQQLQRRMMAFNQLDEDLERIAERIHAQWTPPTNRPSVSAIKALVKKNKYLAAFPQRVQDLYGFDGGVYTPFPGDSGHQPSMFQVDSPFLKQIRDAHNPPLDESNFSTYASNITSSELIYLLLTEGQALGTESPSLDGISSQYITDNNNNGLMEIRDAWGNELQFYNAPTGLFPRDSDGRIDLTRGSRVLFSSIPGDNGQALVESGELFSDPFDKLGRTSGFNDSNFQYYHPNTYFSFLIVSAGPDGDLGLHLPTEGGFERLAQPLNYDPASREFEQMFDNITNRQQ